MNEQRPMRESGVTGPLTSAAESFARPIDKTFFDETKPHRRDDPEAVEKGIEGFRITSHPTGPVRAQRSIATNEARTSQRYVERIEKEIKAAEQGGVGNVSEKYQSPLFHWQKIGSIVRRLTERAGLNLENILRGPHAAELQQRAEENRTPASDPAQLKSVLENSRQIMTDIQGRVEEAKKNTTLGPSRQVIDRGEENENYLQKLAPYSVEKISKNGGQFKTWIGGDADGAITPIEDAVHNGLEARGIDRSVIPAHATLKDFHRVDMEHLQAQKTHESRISYDDKPLPDKSTEPGVRSFLDIAKEYCGIKGDIELRHLSEDQLESCHRAWKENFKNGIVNEEYKPLRAAKEGESVEKVARECFSDFVARAITQPCMPDMVISDSPGKPEEMHQTLNGLILLREMARRDVRDLAEVVEKNSDRQEVRSLKDWEKQIAEKTWRPLTESHESIQEIKPNMVGYFEEVGKFGETLSEKQRASFRSLFHNESDELCFQGFVGPSDVGKVTGGHGESLIVEAAEAWQDDIQKAASKALDREVHAGFVYGQGTAELRGGNLVLADASGVTIQGAHVNTDRLKSRFRLPAESGNYISPMRDDDIRTFEEKWGEKGYLTQAVEAMWKEKPHMAALFSKRAFTEGRRGGKELDNVPQSYWKQRAIPCAELREEITLSPRCVTPQADMVNGPVMGQKMLLDAIMDFARADFKRDEKIFKFPKEVVEREKIDHRKMAKDLAQVTGLSKKEAEELDVADFDAKHRFCMKALDGFQRNLSLEREQAHYNINIERTKLENYPAYRSAYNQRLLEYSQRTDIKYENGKVIHTAESLKAFEDLTTARDIYHNEALGAMWTVKTKPGPEREHEVQPKAERQDSGYHSGKVTPPSVLSR